MSTTNTNVQSGGGSGGGLGSRIKGAVQAVHGFGDELRGSVMGTAESAANSNSANNQHDLSAAGRAERLEGLARLKGNYTGPASTTGAYNGTDANATSTTGATGVAGTTGAARTAGTTEAAAAPPRGFQGAAGTGTGAGAGYGAANGGQNQGYGRDVGAATGVAAGAGVAATAAHGNSNIDQNRAGVRDTTGRNDNNGNYGDVAQDGRGANQTGYGNANQNQNQFPDRAAGLTSDVGGITAGVGHNAGAGSGPGGTEKWSGPPQNGQQYGQQNGQQYGDQSNQVPSHQNFDRTAGATSDVGGLAAGVGRNAGAGNGPGGTEQWTGPQNRQQGQTDYGRQTGAGAANGNGVKWAGIQDGKTPSDNQFARNGGIDSQNGQGNVGQQTGGNDQVKWAGIPSGGQGYQTGVSDGAGNNFQGNQRAQNVTNNDIGPGARAPGGPGSSWS